MPPRRRDERLPAPYTLSVTWFERVIGDTAPEFFDATDMGILTADGRIFYCHACCSP